MLWNLVMNAYSTAENRMSSLRHKPRVDIVVGRGDEDCIEIEVRDTAGGIGPRTLEYMQRSFRLIERVYSHEEDLIDVVNAINGMEGFTNSVGLFFVAVAVNDMDGKVTASTTPKVGSTFRITLPRSIDCLKRTASILTWSLNFWRAHKCVKTKENREWLRFLW